MPLSPLQKVGLAGEILALYPRVRWLLWRHDLPTAVTALRTSPDGEPGRDIPYWQGVRLGRAASRTLALLPTDSRCLVRSLVLIALLARRDIAAQLVIGARGGPDFGAHAWIELGGSPLLDPGAPEYRRLVEI
jgi:hypothetical protein